MKLATSPSILAIEGLLILTNSKMNRISFFLLSLLLFFNSAEAQDVGFSSFFRPGMRLGAMYIPKSDVGKSETAEMLHVRSGFIIPLGGGASLNLKKLKVEAKQSFLNINIGYRKNDWSVLANSNQMTNFSIGYTGVKVGLGKGIWAYSGNVGFIRDINSESISPFALAGLLKIKVKGLNKQNFFGGAVAYNGKRPLIVPIIGWRRKIAKKTHLTALLPIQVDITTKLSKSVKLSFLNTVNGFANQTENNFLNQERNLLQTFGGLKHSLIFNWRVSKSVRFLLEGGSFSIANFQLFDEGRDNRLLKSEANFIPFASFSARINFGKSLIGSQLFGNDG
ncbi:MAG: hypothetical protein ACJAWV_000932 [Flammeovirgaceae bacterium]|jgi:hypothetical protein